MGRNQGLTQLMPIGTFDAIAMLSGQRKKTNTHLKACMGMVISVPRVTEYQQSTIESISPPVSF